MIQLARAQAMCQPSICHLRDYNGLLQILGSILLGGLGCYENLHNGCIPNSKLWEI